jgi:hypothetical protein
MGPGSCPFLTGPSLPDHSVRRAVGRPTHRVSVKPLLQLQLWCNYNTVALLLEYPVLLCLFLVSLPLILPFLVHGAALALPLVALASDPSGVPGVALDPWTAADIRPEVSGEVATVERSAPCRVKVDRQERRAYPRPAIPGPVRMERFRYSACAAPTLTVPSVL